MADPDIFRAYDIRGIYGNDLVDETAYEIGKALVTYLDCRKVVVGRDMRRHSPALFDALTRGLTELGADLIDIGMVSTPMCYFANGFLGADASVMITASHNPGEWNGFKMCRAEAVPIGGDSGMTEIRDIAVERRFAPPADEPGSVEAHDILEDYSTRVRSFAHLERPVRVKIDLANSMGVLEIRAFPEGIEFDAMYGELTGDFPNHEANPLKTETLEALCDEVRNGDYDFGIAFDGDADRVGFVDENGTPIANDLIAALMSGALLEEGAGGTVLYDLRSSRTVKEVIEESGGDPKMCRVGHAFIKKQMREHDAVFASELSGHYYFQDNYFAESSAMASLLVANLVSRSEEPLSRLIEPLRRYSASGEINSRVGDLPAVFDRLRDQFADGRQFEMDGLSVEYDDWWFNVRPSNTEPLVRLNLEADSERLMIEKRNEVLDIIRS